MILSRTDVAQNADVAKTLCHAAILWGDVDLWLRAVRACEADRGISELGSDNVVVAIGEFGFDAIKEWWVEFIRVGHARFTHSVTLHSVERTLEQDSQYSSALQLMTTLEDKAASEGDSAAFAFAKEWAPEWRLKVVSALKNPGVDEAETIVSAGLSAGGAKILEKTWAFLYLVVYSLSDGVGIVESSPR